MKQRAFRVAIRQEGEQIAAYLAPMDSMTDAILVASLHRGVARHADVWNQFRQLAQAIGRAAAEGIGAQVVSIEEEAAPEHEKAGHA